MGVGQKFPPGITGGVREKKRERSLPRLVNLERERQTNREKTDLHQLLPSNEKTFWS